MRVRVSRKSKKTMTVRGRIAHRTYRTMGIHAIIRGITFTVRARIRHTVKRAAIIRARIAQHRLKTPLLIQARLAAEAPIRGVLLRGVVSNRTGRGFTCRAVMDVPNYTSWLLTNIVYTVDDSDVHNKPDRIPRSRLPVQFIIYLNRYRTPSIQQIEQMLIDNLTAYTGWHVLGATCTEMTGATKLYANSNKPLSSTDPA